LISFDDLVNFTTERVKKYGAQYLTFAIFGTINYPLALIYEVFINHDSNGVILRLLASFLCFILLLKNSWPTKYQKFLPLFWYITIIISLPMITSFMLLKNHLSFGWLINFNIGIMIVMLILDSISFVIVECIGIFLGILLFFVSETHFEYHTNSDNLEIFLYMFLCIVILGPIFTRNREIFNHFMQKAKDDTNAELERRVEERTAELKKALAAKTEFLNNISHEIRTPIQGFTAISEGLVEHWHQFDENKKLDLTKTVANNAQRLATLVTNLLDLSKFTANKMLLNLEKVDFVALIEEIINECKNLYLNNKSLDFQFQNLEYNTIILADKKYVIQLLRNLLANAIKFSPDNSVIKISIISLEKEWLFSIKDSGIGIPYNELEEIFEPFAQSSFTKTGAGGTGLGLSICKKIIEAHHGKIWAENNLEGGAGLYFTLPKTS